MFLKHEAKNLNENNLVAPTGFEPVFESQRRFTRKSSHVTRCSVLRKSTRLNTQWPSYAEYSERSVNSQLLGAQRQLRLAITIQQCHGRPRTRSVRTPDFRRSRKREVPLARGAFRQR